METSLILIFTIVSSIILSQKSLDKMYEKSLKKSNKIINNKIDNKIDKIALGGGYYIKNTTSLTNNEFANDWLP